MENAGDPGSQRFVIALRMSIKIDRAAFGLDPANGIMINGSKINVSIQDCRNITGTLEPNTIRWSNGIVWTKPIDVATNLVGLWDFGEPGHANISVSGTSLTIDMSDFGIGDGHGTIENDSFRVNFADGSNFVGTIECQHKIKWSNGTVWTKFIPEGWREWKLFFRTRLWFMITDVYEILYY